MLSKTCLYIFIPVSLGLSLLLSGCASLTGFQDGRTAGKGNSEIIASINFSQSPNFDDLESDSTFNDVPTLFFPSIEVLYSYGVLDRLNVSAKLNTNLTVAFGAKYQLLGDLNSPTALAIGAEVGTFGLITGLWNIQVPVSFSVHPSESFTWYLSPRYIYQFFTYTGAENGVNYIGGNTGLLFGSKHKFGVDVGYYRVGTSDASAGIIQIGVGGKFSF